MSQRLPEWLKTRLPSDTGEVKRVARLLRERHLATVCTGAKCPNLADCWACGTATLMVLGRECTRNCRFCAVPTEARPAPPDPAEPRHVAEVVAELGLRYAVITSVTRDDLPDGGAAHFAAVVRAIKEACPETVVELLIPDLGGSAEALAVVAGSGAEVVGHNLETTRRLTGLVRDGRADYDRSLEVLRRLASHPAKPAVKTALLLGLGETDEEVEEALRQAFDAGARHVAMGQYLAPSSAHHPVVRYRTPEEFEALGERALALGFETAASAPFVRSSYKAEAFIGSRLRGS
jgi:lipoic acid synthetase